MAGNRPQALLYRDPKHLNGVTERDFFSRILISIYFKLTLKEQVSCVNNVTFLSRQYNFETAKIH